VAPADGRALRRAARRADRLQLAGGGEDRRGRPCRPAVRRAAPAPDRLRAAAPAAACHRPRLRERPLAVAAAARRRRRPARLLPRTCPLVAVLACERRLRVTDARRADAPRRRPRRARPALLRARRVPRPPHARRSDARAGLHPLSGTIRRGMEEQRPLQEQLAELGAQLDWVREYL